MPPPIPKRRWYHLTPTRFFVGLLAVQVFLFLSERFRWFPFNENKGWTVLIAVGVVCAAIVVMLVWGLVCLLFRQRFQFSFQSLLVFLVTVSIPLGWFAWEMQRARRQREVVEGILEANAEVLYDYQLSETTTPAWLRKLLGGDFFCEVVRIVCQGTGYGDEDARDLKELTHLKGLVLANTQITDDGLCYLKDLTELERLELGNTQITDKGLAQLEGMTKLETLALDWTQITDNGLTHLTGMNRLEVLDLTSTQITDNGLANLSSLTELKSLSLMDTPITGIGLGHLKEMTKLKALWLGDTQITDTGLVHLKRLTNLELLYLAGTQVTDEGVKALQQALPKCGILRYST
jgi:hypothetical protein